MCDQKPLPQFRMHSSENEMGQIVLFPMRVTNRLNIDYEMGCICKQLAEFGLRAGKYFPGLRQHFGIS